MEGIGAWAGIFIVGIKSRTKNFLSECKSTYLDQRVIFHDDGHRVCGRGALTIPHGQPVGGIMLKKVQ